MPSATVTKADMLRLVASLPDDATVEDAIERLLMVEDVKERLAARGDAPAVSNDEVFQRLNERLTHS